MFLHIGAWVHVSSIGACRRMRCTCVTKTRYSDCQVLPINTACMQAVLRECQILPINTRLRASCLLILYTGVHASHRTGRCEYLYMTFSKKTLWIHSASEDDAQQHKNSPGFSGWCLKTMRSCPKIHVSMRFINLVFVFIRVYHV